MKKILFITLMIFRYSFVGIGLTLTMSSNAVAVLMTFDTVPSDTILPYDEVYTENGMMAISKSNHSLIGDQFQVNLTNMLYFHGTNEYIEFKMVDGSLFDLLSLDFLTNGYTNNRWLETSTGTTTLLPGYTTVTTISFSGTDYSNLEWFRIGTPWFATQLDNITFDVSSVPVPEPSTMLLLSSSLAWLGLMRRKLRVNNHPLKGMA